LPDMPTMSELGIRGLEEVYTWLGLLGPANLPQPIVAKLHAEITASCERQRWRSAC
jgi:tripartite-type tricarboxylate transporter receptor subunit TctC